jgi:transcriptional regulator with XRE-family HTH domain
MQKITHSDQLTLSLGAKIRSLRVERNLKISDLATMTDLTSSMISQLERGLISPSLASLKKICDSLSMPISYLFEDEESVPQNNGVQVFNLNPNDYTPMGSMLKLMGQHPVVHKDNRKLLSPGKGMRFYLLNPNMAGPIEMVYNEYDPGADTGRYNHPGSECGLILSGELHIEVNGKEYILKEGDSITFESTDIHRKWNESDVMCTSVWANTPPWF